MAQIPGTTGVLVILALWAVIAVLSVVVPFTVPPPPAWLEAWTKLVAAAAASAIGIRYCGLLQSTCRRTLDRKS